MNRQNPSESQTVPPYHYWSLYKYTSHPRPVTRSPSQCLALPPLDLARRDETTDVPLPLDPLQTLPRLGLSSNTASLSDFRILAESTSRAGRVHDIPQDEATFVGNDNLDQASLRPSSSPSNQLQPPSSHCRKKVSYLPK